MLNYTNISNYLGGGNIIKKVLFLFLILFSAVLISGSASAATINVNNSTANSIGNAITKANAGDTLNLSSGTYKEHDLVIDKNLTITGPTTTGTPTAIIDAQQQGRVFQINSGVTVNLKYLTIQNGTVVNDFGGGIFNSGNLTVNNCIIKDNNAGSGGGIYNNDGTLTVKDSSVTGNTAINGGGITIRGTCNVIGSTINGNIQNGVDGWGGGGIYIGENGTLNVINSTINSNKAVNSQFGGGGIFICNGSIVTVTNSNLKYNTSNNDGGAIYNITGKLTVIGCDVAYNKANGNGNAIFTNLNDSIKLNFNQFYDPETGYEIYNKDVTVDAKYNWWGSNASPTSKVYGSVTVTPWLVLKITTNPTVIRNGTTSKITVNLLYDSYGTYHNPINGHIPHGISISFTTTKGSINSAQSLNNGAVTVALKGGVISGVAIVSSKLNNQTVTTSVIIDNTPPKISSTVPTNYKTGFYRAGTIILKFSENIYASTYYNKITVKNLLTGKITSIINIISGNTLYIKTRTVRSANTWYQVIIPAGAVKDRAGNILAKAYTFKFKTGTK